MKQTRTSTRTKLIRMGVTALAIPAALAIGLIDAPAAMAASSWTSFTCGNPEPYQYQSATFRTGVPDRCMWAEVQEVARGHGGGYTGPLDGIMGPNSWRGIQNVLNAGGCNAGVADGVPGKNTYSAMQRAARAGGYTGPIDGVMGPNSWKGFSSVIQFANYKFVSPRC